MTRSSRAVRRVGLRVGLWLMILPTAVGSCSSFGADSAAPPPPPPPPLEGGTGEDAAGAESGAGIDAGVAGIIGWWPLDALDTFGAVPDMSGFGHDGELASAGETPTFVTDGQHRAIKMSGSPFAIRGLDSHSFPTTGTLAVWVKQTTADGGANIVDMYDEARSHLFFRIQDNNHQISMQRGLEVYVFDWSAPAKDRWTHLAITWSNADQRATTYLDTSQVKTAAYVLGDAGPFAPVDENLIIGAGFVGLLDDLKLYDRVLDRAEIERIAR